MFPHSFGYLAFVLLETLIMASVMLYAWHLKGEIRELRQLQSAKLASRTAEALAHLIEECETQPTVAPEEPELAAAPPDRQTHVEIEDAPVLADVRTVCWVVAQRGRRQCAHRSR